MRKVPIKCVGTTSIVMDRFHDELELYFDYHGVKIYKDQLFFDIAEFVAKDIYPGKKVRVLNSRLHNMGPGVKLKKHVDSAMPAKEYKVIHIPLKTNRKATLSFEYKGKEIKRHLKLGYVYELNNTYPHWGANEGTTDRLHIVAYLFVYDGDKNDKH